MPELPSDYSARPTAGHTGSRFHGYGCLFAVLGGIGTVVACSSGDEKLLVLWDAWAIALTSTAAVWMTTVAFRRALTDDGRHGLPGESWLPLRGRWLRALIVAPVVVPCVVLGWLFGTLLLGALGEAVQAMLCR